MSDSVEPFAPPPPDASEAAIRAAAKAWRAKLISAGVIRPNGPDAIDRAMDRALADVPTLRIDAETTRVHHRDARQPIQRRRPPWAK